MHPEVKARFEKLETRRIALVQRVRGLSPEQQQAKPDSRTFSPAEVLMHFYLAEFSDVAFLKKTPPSSLQGKKPRVTFVFRKMVAWMENPVKAMMTVGYMVPRGSVDVEEASVKWEEIRAELKRYFEAVSNPEEPFCKFQFFLGLASANDFLRLMESHMTYHELRFPTFGSPKSANPPPS